MAIAAKRGLLVIEDAAQGVLAAYKGRAPWLHRRPCRAVISTRRRTSSLAKAGCSFVNNPRFIERAEIVREKGTNRSQFFRGQVDKYTWVDIGSSFFPSEIIAAFLWAQMEAGRVANRAPPRNLETV